MNLVSCSVVENREITPGNFLLTLKVPRGFSRPAPGQFVHLRVSPEVEPLLRRPYSLEGFVESGGIRAVRIYYSVVGRGSRSLRKLRAKRRPYVFLFGARGARELYGVREVRGARLHLATDDGSVGYHGSVLTLLRREWESEGHTPLTAEIFTCGPHGLLHEVAEFARAHGIRCQASLEGPMACAVGACRGCPVPLRGGNGNGGRYPAMCLEGPVMDATLVDWERLP